MEQRPRITLSLETIKPKRVFIWIFAILVAALMVFPVFVSLNELLTAIVLNLKGYRFVLKFIVPLEVRWVSAILNFLGVNAYSAGEYVLIRQIGRQSALVELIWNCVGWQSLIMFIVTGIVGFSRDYSIISRIKAFVLGFLGTFLVNILRIVLVILAFSGVSPKIASVFHEYGALIINTGWLFFFWWFVSNFILEKKADAC